MRSAQVNLLADNRRLHLHHGPIDLIIEAFGAKPEIRRAYELAIDRFDNLLVELVDELPELRKPYNRERKLSGKIARAMALSVGRFDPEYITPMAAVAGSVADEILRSLLHGTCLEKAYVNNGGDTAFYLAENQKINAGIAISSPATVTLSHCDQYRGIATSGWRGRSLSFGIADSVCVVGDNAALADAAATMIANKVSLPGHKAIGQTPACDIFPDSDLGARAVTTSVGKLTRREKQLALAKGKNAAKSYLSRGIIGAALLVLGDEQIQVGAQNLIHIKTGELAHA